ncbi:ferredoxin [Bradyrhizobium sp. USDA 3650]
MAYKIVASQCTVCGACEFECPNAAISLKRDIYVIDAKKCTECEGPLRHAAMRGGLSGP